MLKNQKGGKMSLSDIYDQWDYENQMNRGYAQAERREHGHCAECKELHVLRSGLCFTCNARRKNGQTEVHSNNYVI